MSQEKALSVSELNKRVSTWIQSNPDLKSIWVRGEISNFTIAPSGHFYFSLKDSISNIRCTFFQGRSQSYSGRPLKNGMEVLALGNINVYEPRGEYSLNISKIEEVGQGDIFLKVERLKRELFERGIFDPSHKKSLPKIPKTIGVATSPTGAAIEDIIRIATTNYPNINILIAPCLVQGTEAPQSIVQAIELLNDPRWKVDVIIAGRGGGSYEDLMAFNEESVVMAYYNSKVPIISAVGHEIDKVLSDFAADMHAPTPTAAAKLAVPIREEIEEFLIDLHRRTYLALKNQIQKLKEKLIYLTSMRSMTDPQHYLEEKVIYLDDLLTKISLIGKNLISGKKEKISVFEKIGFRMEQNLERKSSRFHLAKARLENFSPLDTLSRGFAVVRNQEKKVVKDIKDISQTEVLEIIFSKGRAKVEVKETYL